MVRFKKDLTRDLNKCNRGLRVTSGINKVYIKLSGREITSKYKFHVKLCKVTDFVLNILVYSTFLCAQHLLSQILEFIRTLT